MRYTVRHVTRFSYDTPITESVMEARMQPRSDGLQRCLHFALTAAPTARVKMYQDHDGNTVHYFNIPARHARLTLTADALVECDVPKPIPHRVGPGAWAQLDALAASGECWEWTAPSPFTRATPRLDAFARELCLERGHDPLVVLRRVMSEIYTRFEYKPQSTRVDSPIDEALEARRGVCQDFAHIFIALMRPLRIPTRYVSGYLFRDLGSHDRSSEGASHAWAESFIPGLGWVGFDPTNNSDRRSPPHPGGHRTRLCRCTADARGLQGRHCGQKRAGSGGERRSRHLAAGWRRPAIHPLDVARRRRADLESRNERHPRRTSNNNRPPHTDRPVQDRTDSSNAYPLHTPNCVR